MASTDQKQGSDMEMFKGNQFTTLRGIILWGGLIFAVVMLILNYQHLSVSRLIAIPLFITGWFFLWSFSMHYFLVSGDDFIVKNHNYTWKHKVYKLSDIEISFETDQKQGNFLRVWTKKDKNKVYLATTLREKHWLRMKEMLEQKRMTVQNDFF